MVENMKKEMGYRELWMKGCGGAMRNFDKVSICIYGNDIFGGNINFPLRDTNN